jgi:ADP-ribose pyrophosphatase
MDETFTRIERRTAFTGRIFDVHVDRVRLPIGREIDLEVVRHPRSVVLLPMAAADQLVLVRQYRYPVDRWLWELPAGSLDPGEEPEAAALRECHEEIGKTATRATFLGSFFPTPGFCDEEMYFYRLEDLREPTSPAVQDEDELLEPQVFGLDELRGMVLTGEITDMKTVVGIGLLSNPKSSNP